MATASTPIKRGEPAPRAAEHGDERLVHGGERDARGDGDAGEDRPVGPVVGCRELDDPGDEKSLRRAERGRRREAAQCEHGRGRARGERAPRDGLQRHEGGEAAEPQREHREERDRRRAEERRADSVRLDRIRDDVREARRLVVRVGGDGVGGRVEPAGELAGAVGERLDAVRERLCTRRELVGAAAELRRAARERLSASRGLVDAAGELRQPAREGAGPGRGIRQSGARRGGELRDPRRRRSRVAVGRAGARRGGDGILCRTAGRGGQRR